MASHRRWTHCKGRGSSVRVWLGGLDGGGPRVEDVWAGGLKVSIERAVLICAVELGPFVLEEVPVDVFSRILGVPRWEPDKARLERPADLSIQYWMTYSRAGET